MIGESMPVLKRVDDMVTGATVVEGGGPIYLRVWQLGADSRLAQIVRLVQQAQGSKAPIQAWADWVPLLLHLQHS
jgi:Cu+-exporting ATPase